MIVPLGDWFHYVMLGALGTALFFLILWRRSQKD